MAAPSLVRTYFICKGCGAEDFIDAAETAQVVAGPLCTTCKQPMRRIDFRQVLLPIDMPSQARVAPLKHK